MKFWITVILAGVLTFFIRYSFIGLSGRVNLPKKLTEAFEFVPAAALAALVVPVLLVTDNVIELTNNRFIAGCFAIVVAWFGKNILVTVTSGMVILWFLQALGA